MRRLPTIGETWLCDGLRSIALAKLKRSTYLSLWSTWSQRPSESKPDISLVARVERTETRNLAMTCGQLCCKCALCIALGLHLHNGHFVPTSQSVHGNASHFCAILPAARGSRKWISTNLHSPSHHYPGIKREQSLNEHKIFKRSPTLHLRRNSRRTFV